MKKSKNFIITAIRIYEDCDSFLRKGLKDEWYLLSNRVRLTSENKLELSNENIYINNLWGKGINIIAIVGSNGSGKSSLLEILYRIVNNLSAILQKGKQRKAAETLYFIAGLYAEVYYIIDDQLLGISCKGNCLSLILPDSSEITLYAFQYNKNDIVSMKEFIYYTKKYLFYRRNGHLVG